MEKNLSGYVDSDYLTAFRDLFAPVKQRSYELMGDIVNKHILDIGCGPGLDTVAMAKLVGERGRAFFCTIPAGNQGRSYCLTYNQSDIVAAVNAN